MNRRGEGALDFSLVTVLKLVLGALVLVAIVWMSIDLISVFIHRDEGWRANQNLKYLVDRAKAAQVSGVATVVLHVPENYALIGFDPGMEGPLVFKMGLVEGAVLDDIEIKPPCKACVCSYRFSSGLTPKGMASRADEIECVDFDAKHMTGSWTEVEWRQRDLGADYHPDATVPDHPNGGKILLIPHTAEPQNVQLTWSSGILSAKPAQ